MTYTLYNGDCLEYMRTMPDGCVDAVVTDPPYGLKFMGKLWDHGVPGEAFWAEALRVAKPGAHLLAFGGTRTYHRLVCAIEDAGWEIRDTIAWVYGSGFPKSLDVSKAIDREAGAERAMVGTRQVIIDRWTAEGRRRTKNGESGSYAVTETTPSTDAARQWNGWGTSLKPSFEPVIWARKPLHNLVDCAIMLQNLTQMEAELCEHIANIAAKSLQLTPHGSNGAKADFAQMPVVTQAGAATASETATGAEGVTNLEAAISGSTLEAVHIALNTISLWRSILEDALSLASTSTTEMASSLTTDLKTWSLSLSQITLDSIIQAALNPSGLTAPVSGAVLYSSVISAKLSAIQELTAQGLVSREKHLTPSFEPIVVARKPIDGTVAHNVLTYGTGAINIDGCRVGIDDAERIIIDNRSGGQVHDATGEWQGPGIARRIGERFISAPQGRWPANLIHDGSDEVLAVFPETVGTGRPNCVGKYYSGVNEGGGNAYGDGYGKRPLDLCYIDTGSAARYFYCAKASKEDRDSGLDGMPVHSAGECTDRTDGTAGLNSPRAGAGRTSGSHNNHPTVKPHELMKYLCRLVTPPGGTVLDPFMGSGSTGKAAIAEGFNFIGCDLSAEYVEIARLRIADMEQRADDEQAQAQRQPPLFTIDAPKAKQIGLFDER